MRTVAAVLATFSALLLLPSFATANGFVTTLAGTDEIPFDETLDGDALKTRIDPSDLTYSPSGELHFIDWKHAFPRIRKITADGERVVTVAGAGRKLFNGDGPALKVNVDPSEIAFTPDGLLYFVEGTKVRVFNPILNRVDTLIQDQTTADGKGGARIGVVPSSLAVSPEGEVYFVDKKVESSKDTWRIRKLTHNGNLIETVAGGRDGEQGVQVPIRPYILKFSRVTGELFFTDNRAQIRKMTRDYSAVQAVAGTGVMIDIGDGLANEVNIFPHQLAFTPNGDIFFTDGLSAIRTVTSNEHQQAVVKTLVQSNADQLFDHVEDNCKFPGRSLIATRAGDLYVLADCGLWGCSRIANLRHVPTVDGTPFYTLRTVAGRASSEFNGDGPTTRSNINPTEIIEAPTGGLVFVDGGGENTTARIRMVTLTPYSQRRQFLNSSEGDGRRLMVRSSDSTLTTKLLEKVSLRRSPRLDNMAKQ